MFNVMISFAGTEPSILIKLSGGCDAGGGQFGPLKWPATKKQRAADNDNDDAGDDNNTTISRPGAT
jgi:hypothetical protein